MNAEHGQTVTGWGVYPSSWAAFLAGLVIMITSFHRLRLGVGGVQGESMLVDLRDRSGITQLVINPELAPEAVELAHQIRNEFVLRAEGTLVARSA